MSAWRVGIDIGGTFTDAALVDGETGPVRVVKVLTTPEDPAEGFITALERASRSAGPGAATWPRWSTPRPWRRTRIIEGKTARVGMLVTRGFRDILEIGRQIRSRLYDVHLQKPAPLVPRRWSLEVRERLDAEGRVLEPLDVGEVRAAVRRLRDEGVEAVVICFLHSYLNPAHERAAAAIVREEMPDAWLSVSSEVCPEFREYLRGSTAAVNAAVMPIVSRYLDALESRLAAPRRHRAVLRDAVERRRDDVGVGQGAARLHGRVGAGRGGHRRGRVRRAVRLPQRAVVRHGRHDRQGRPDPGRAAPALDRDGGRARRR